MTGLWWMDHLNSYYNTDYSKQKRKYVGSSKRHKSFYLILDGNTTIIENCYVLWKKVYPYSIVSTFEEYTIFVLGVVFKIPINFGVIYDRWR